MLKKGARGLPHGLKIRQVFSDSPAAKAGLKEGDILMSWAGRPLKSISDIQLWLALAEPGQDVAIEYWKLDPTVWKMNPNRWNDAEAVIDL